jgi:hypothetical protein
VREAADEKISRARDEADAKVQAARDDTTRQADAHRETLERLGREHTDARAAGARQVAAAEGALELLQQRVRDGLTRLVRVAAATVATTEPGPENDPAQQLHRAVAAQMALRHGVEDLARDLELDD